MTRLDEHRSLIYSPNEEQECGIDWSIADISLSHPLQAFRRKPRGNKPWTANSPFHHPFGTFAPSSFPSHRFNTRRICAGSGAGPLSSSTPVGGARVTFQG